MKKKKIIITVIICIMILACATVFSVVKFNVWNPFSSCFGMLRILFTNTEYTIVQHIPNKVGFSKTLDTSNKSGGQYLEEYMAERGFYILPEEQLGGVLVFSNGNEKEYVGFSTNKYYSKWIWEKQIINNNKKINHSTFDRAEWFI